jgi:C-terminal processing protease CtpA/Prc
MAWLRFPPWLLSTLVLGAVLAHGEEVKRVLVPAPSGAEKEAQAEAAVRQAAFLGVQTALVPESLAGHLDLPAGFGLMVEEVLPGRPAAKAGLRRFDVLLRYQDQQLVNMDQLQVLVRSGKKGEQVRLLVLSLGKEKHVVATLDEGPVEVAPQRVSMKKLTEGALSMLGQGEDWERRQAESKARVEQFHEQMKSYQRQLESWGKDGSWVGNEVKKP